MKNYTLIIFLLMGFGFLAAQEGKELKANLDADGVAFKSLNEFYIYGDSKVIGNNILSNHKTKAFNDMQVDNDDLKMKYVDIDEDDETFSSSSAKLKLPSNYKKISYAGLYWSATYSYNKGTRRKDRGNYVFKGDGNRNPEIEKIKFKTPNGDYKDIIGNVIYDGSKNVTHAINSPYVCYAEVTDILKNASEINGDFTVANVKASTGYISGGSAGGWMLYIVYQAPTDNPKYISTFNGFTLVNDQPVDIKFKNFKSIDQGDVRTSIVVSALEGDNSLMEDECSIIKRNGKFQSLSNGVRNQFNFFNSSITNNSMANRERTPNSTNTLGFDIAELKIPNYNNAIIGNNTNETTLRLKTKADRYYLFFTAFQTEISQTFFEDVIKEKEPVSIVTTVEPEVIRTTAIEEKKSKRKFVWTKPKRKGLNSREFKLLKNKSSIVITDIKSGYYVITNVFSESARAAKWEANLIIKGYAPKTFFNPKNGWYYVYVLQTEKPEKAFNKQQDLIQKRRYRDTWILKVNLD